MKSFTTDRFRKAFRNLPQRVRAQVRRSYRRFLVDPDHPSLQFKRVHSKKPIYSARVGRSYRALGILDGDHIVWFWVGSHSDYDELLRRV